MWLDEVLVHFAGACDSRRMICGPNKLVLGNVEELVLEDVVEHRQIGRSRS